MADVSDVCNALVAVAVQALYPNGTGQASVANVPVIAYQGWPDPATLDIDMPAGKVHVSVFARPEERNTSRFAREPQTLVVNTPTLTATIAGQTITIGGAVPASNNPTNVAVEVNGFAWVYAVQPTDTLTGIATALAALIAVNVPSTTNTGPVITLPATARISAARVGVTATMIRELRRQEKQFQITVWAGTPALRDAVAQPLDLVMALEAQQFIVMPDTFAARLIYHGTRVLDQLSKATVYRRDLLYTVEYATTQVIAATQVTQEIVNVTPVNAATATLVL